MTPEVEKEVEISFRRTQLIMIASGVAMLAFLALNYFLAQNARPSANSDYGMLRVSFTVIVAFLCFGSIILRRYMFREMKLHTILTGGGIKAMLDHLSRTSIILAAITEAAAIMGLVFGVTTGDMWFAADLILVGFLVFIVSFPRRSSWLRAAAYAEQNG
ncbi:MAG TPA: hypothetical protein VFC63_04640 [Blastocatellia bacterium]|nr:hypothetical protein [Blastocatellia bacterium]